MAASVLLGGCDGIGTHAIPTVSSTTLPEGNLTVHLYGPDRGGVYHYGVYTSDSSVPYGTRSLGTPDVSGGASPAVRMLDPGIYRITWGTGASAPYVTIDTRRQRVVEDSNPGNKRDHQLVRQR